MNKLTISHPQISVLDGKARLSATVKAENFTETLWFETSEQFGDGLCFERSDAFVAVMLLYAMPRGLDIQYEAPLSEQYHFMLNDSMLDLLAQTYSGFKKISLHGPVASERLSSLEGVGTGISCGVDSLTAIARHSGEVVTPSFRITHLAFFNVGSHGSFGGESVRTLFHERMDIVRDFAKSINLPLVDVDSNVSEILGLDFLPFNTFRTIAAALAMQKMFSRYYFASSYHLDQFALDPAASGHFDVYTTTAMSTKNISFILSEIIHTRVEKTRFLLTYEPSKRFLNVCVTEAANCSVCWKCVRTLNTLEIFGMLDEYSDVFDLARYRKVRNKGFARSIVQNKSDTLYGELYDEIEKTGFKVGITVYIYVFLYKIKSDILSPIKKFLQDIFRKARRIFC